MSDWGKCKSCRVYTFLNSHKCAPVWEARVAGDGDDWYEVNARDAEGAAEKFAEQYDESGEYGIIRYGSAEIEVRKLGDDTVLLMDISAESVPQYRACARPTTPALPPQDSSGGAEG